MEGLLPLLGKGTWHQPGKACVESGPGAKLLRIIRHNHKSGSKAVAGIEQHFPASLAASMTTWLSFCQQSEQKWSVHTENSWPFILLLLPYPMAGMGMVGAPLWKWQSFQEAWIPEWPWDRAIHWPGTLPWTVIWERKQFLLCLSHYILGHYLN